jgi:hypothetical protein
MSGTIMHILLDGEGALRDIEPDKIIHTTEPWTVLALAGGMESKKPSVAFVIALPDGHVVLAETSMRLFHVAAKAFAARYGWLGDGVEWHTGPPPD